MELLQTSKQEYSSRTHSSYTTFIQPNSNSNHSLVLNTNSKIDFGKKSLSWIIDIEATYHITKNISLLVNSHHIKPIAIHLPNNTIATSNLVSMPIFLLVYNLLMSNLFQTFILISYMFPQLVRENNCSDVFLLLTLVHFCMTNQEND